LKIESLRLPNGYGTRSVPYNAGRLITAIGPFIVGDVASRSDNPLQTALQLLFFVGFIPLLGILVMPLIIETKNRKLIA
jgi:hypothetical protein